MTFFPPVWSCPMEIRVNFVNWTHIGELRTVMIRGETSDTRML